MKRIEDEEVKAKFDEAWNDFCAAGYMIRDYVDFAEHFFQAGRDSLVKELMDVEAIAASKPKRIIEKLIKTDQGWFALSNTGEWFYFNRPLDSEPYWIKYPDLPQED